MIADGKIRYCLAVEILSRLLRGTASRYNGDYYSVNYLLSFKTANKYKSHKTFIRIMIIVSYKWLKFVIKYLNLRMNKNILKHRIDAQKIHKCDNGSEETFATKTSKHTTCSYSWFTHCLFDNNKKSMIFTKGLTT